jgi:hypothetical protein
MENSNMKSRRAFFRSGAGALGAGVAMTTGLGAATSQASVLPDAVLHAAEREAIQRLHSEHLARMQVNGEAVTYRPRLTAQPDSVRLSMDGRRAQAVYHVEAETVTPLEGESTLVQMARLQGHVADRRVQAGRLEVEYSKQAADWRITSLRFIAA